MTGGHGEEIMHMNRVHADDAATNRSRSAQQQNNLCGEGLSIASCVSLYSYVTTSGVKQ